MTARGLAGGLVLLAAACAPTPSALGLAELGEVTPPGDVVRFVALGDTGLGNGSQRLVAKVMQQVCAERGCDFAVLLGDNLYPSGPESPEDPEMDRVFTDVYDEVPLRFYTVLGNHDYGDSRDAARAASEIAWAAGQQQMVLPTHTYGFSAGPARFWALDTTHAFWYGGGSQASWLDASLPSATAAWKVAFGHHPYRSNGHHGNAGDYEGQGWMPYASGGQLQTLFEDHLCGQVDLYLSGHEHNRQWIEACGTTWIVSGAGARTTPLEDRGNAPVFAIAEEGLVWIELGPDAMRFAFYDEDATREFEATKARDGRVDVAPTGAPLAVE
jgi:hypothetical protein